MTRDFLMIALVLLTFSYKGYSQNSKTLELKSGTYLIEKNSDYLQSSLGYSEEELVEGSYYRIIQFEQILTQEEKELLSSKGIHLMDYIPSHAFISRIEQHVDLDELKQFNVHAVSKIEPAYKLSKKLHQQTYDEWAVFGKNIQLNAVAYEHIDKNQVISKLDNLGAKVVNSNYMNIIQLGIPIAKLNQLYSLPHFYYFEQIDAPGEPENLVGVTNHRSNNLATEYASGLKYDGTGITVMLQDNSRLDEHIDYTGRFFDINSTQSGDHGEHCGGTIAGAGNLDPVARGMAYGADVLVYDANNNNYNSVPTIYTNDDVRITSKSYSNGTNAGYTSLARQLDQQTRQMPDLIHVFSAGNSNGSGSTAAGGQWFNITGGHKAGKNVIAVGNLTNEDVIASSSSRGPAEDGRIKPDISAVGTNVYSTVDPNTYDSKTGTSMACPGVAGVLAQLYHAYKDMNGGTNPPAGLIKAAVLNTGDDLGNPGPDFIYGWGRINARRAYDIISNNNYITSSVSQGSSNSHNINVPANTDQLRIMVYWTDYEGATNASPALVNDINMTVIDPNTASYNPWVLDPTPNATTLDMPAVRGVDNLNNMEQVTIDNPVAGTYDVSISGFSIPQGPQTYYIVYEFVTDDVVLTYPIGGEHFNDLVSEKIRWDAYGNSGTFDLEYSTNNGSSWNTIATGINATQRFYTWNVPAVVTGQALVRVTRGVSTSQSHEPFSIIGVPTGLTVNWACPDSIEVAWNSVNGATGYEVSLLGNKYMDSVGTVMGSTNLVIAANASQSHWWSVKALGPNNCVGRRAIAQYHSGGTFNCILPIDVAIDSIYPSDGAVSECELDSFNIKALIRNSSTGSLSNIPVYYSLNGGAPIASVFNGTLNSGEDTLFTFTPAISLSSGNYDLDVWVDYTGDGNFYNDTLSSSFIYNTSILTLPFTQDFESDNLCSTANDCGNTICALNNEWINETNGIVDDIDFRVNEGPTPSRVGITPNETGPTQDFNPGTSTGNYIYTEASAGCNFQYAHLISPCIDLTSATNPLLSFAYHMYDLQGANMMGNLNVDIKINGVWTNQITPQILSDQGDMWHIRTVDLSPYIGNTINLRFRAGTGAGWRSDIAIDDISISETLSIDENDLSNLFNVYPNPSKGLVNFNYYGDNTAFVKVIDTKGRLVHTKTIQPKEKGSLDISNQPKGLYLVVVNTVKESRTIKLIID